MKSAAVRNSVMASITLLTLVLAGTSPANADGGVNGDAVADAVAAAAPIALDGLEVERSANQLISAFPQGGRIEVGVDADDAVAFSTANGEMGAVVSLPGKDNLGDAVVNSDNSVTFPGDTLNPSVNLMSAENTVRVSTVIAGQHQTEEFDYDFGDGATVEIQENGSALIVADASTNSDEHIERILATIDEPWAVDASGAPVDTNYVAKGSVLTQVVHHQERDVAYPVVADPSFDQPNILQYRVRFNRAETATIAQYGLASLGGAVCGPVMGIACIAAAGAIAWNAGVAQNSNPKRCVQITGTNTLTPLNVVWWVDTYRGGPCK